ncbi:LANO_0G05996g1_1 [Lachancea nothofagi CBS 11611]|uniref:LANO_0G05996g1_1 n=1 Tax=Lachancea nothofagi CBS 11611 TaxID=1266666 RepID=A0A1G4KH55_9SACH|nr:LANO_0G05996g1_1 [Lachancea nothofagi CBS 11611]
MSAQGALFGVRRAVWLFSLVHAIQGHPLIYASEPEAPKEADFVTFLGISILLVLLGGVFAGLTLALMGQDELYLKVISTSGSTSEQKAALRVLKLISKGKHWVLVTLLLSNVITNETLPIVLDRCLGGGWQAVVCSTVLIVIFGEVIPQSVCVRYGLEIGAFFCPFVELLMYLMYPLAYPVSLLLDWILGEDHGTMYKKSGLKTLVTLHRTMGVDRLTNDEVTIISAVLDLKEKKVCEIMTPIVNVFTMSADAILDEKTVGEIFNSGFSRIPIHLPGEKNNFIGMLLVRVLISYDPDDCLPVSHFPLATLPETSPKTSCLNILNYFQEGKSHMCIVSQDPGNSVGALGVLTLEDVIEELIGEEIVDESDVFVDIHQRIMREQPGPLSKRHITSYLHSLYKTTQRNSIDQSEEVRPLLESAQEASQNSKAPALLPGVVPFNLASNPLHTQNPHVKVKRLPEVSNDPVSAKYRATSPTYGGTSTSPRAETNSPISNKLHEQHVQTTADGSQDMDILQEHLDAAKRAIQHTRDTGERTQVTTSKQQSPMEEPSAISSHHGSDVHRSLTNSINDQSDTPTETQMISSSYRTSIKGIVESVVTVKGVPKTIIEPAKNWDESQDVVINENNNVLEVGGGNSEGSHDLDEPSSSRPPKSRRGSLFSLFRQSSAGGSSSSIRGRSNQTSASSERLDSDALNSDDVYSMRNHSPR